MMLCIGSLVVSVLCDSLESNVSREILLREARLEVSKLVQTKSKAGGLRALDRFANRIEQLADDSDGGSISSKDGDTNKEEAAGDQDEGTPKSKRVPKVAMQPGWGGKSAWGGSDWLTWILLGPVLTVVAVVFTYYMWGWPSALAILVCLLVVDVVAFYLNV